MIALLVAALCAPAQDAAASIPVREVLAVESLGVRGRHALTTDALEHALALGTFAAPSAGDEIASTTGEVRTWARFEASEDGWLAGAPFGGGWAFATVEVPASGAWTLDVNGPSLVIVDGEPRYGDVYQLGITRIPLHLDAGTHELLFRTGRGRMRATLEPAPARAFLEGRDVTKPNVVRGEGGEVLVGLLVSNAGPEVARGLRVRFTIDGGEPAVRDVPPLLPSSQRKCAFALPVPAEPEGERVAVRAELLDADGGALHETELALGVVDPGAKHVRTFRSGIDGSVQYYSVVPPSGRLFKDSFANVSLSPALVLTLHGASVEATSQTRCYAPRLDTWIVAPTNRRPFGFDWEDWGRMDALEVLALAEMRYATDPDRTYLTGHSMGGHGTWQLGAHFPDRFAALAPSAGWCDFWGYGGALEIDAEDAVSRLMMRATNPSRTLLLKENYLQSAIYVLHGDADETVPVSEARAMRAELGAFHPNFAYYEREGAGHWWGDQCMDWPPLMEFLERNERPRALDAFAFTTVNPGISSRCRFVEIEQQTRALEPSRVAARLEPVPDSDERVLHVETENVRRLAVRREDLPLAPPRESGLPSTSRVRLRSLVIDDTKLEGPFDDGELAARRAPSGAWTLCDSAEPSGKSPARSGPFKDAFRNRMVFVYGTTGTPEENAWSLAKARYDLETWRYRGNGAVDVVADTEFDPAAEPDRGVVLYGNADTNSAFARVLGTDAVELTRERVRIGDRVLEGDDLALLAVRPRPGSDVACVAIVGGTGLAGCRVTDHRLYFVSGVAYPDWCVLDASSLLRGAEGVRGAGFFAADWSCGAGAEAAWR